MLRSGKKKREGAFTTVDLPLNSSLGVVNVLGLFPFNYCNFIYQSRLQKGAKDARFSCFIFFQRTASPGGASGKEVVKW